VIFYVVEKVSGATRTSTVVAPRTPAAAQGD